MPATARGTPAAPASTIDAVTLEKMYGAPSATTRETGRMTYDDVIVRTGGLLALLVVVAAASWALTDQLPWLYWVGAIAGLVLGLVNAFRREPSPALIVAYTIAEGVFVGGISYLFTRFAVEGTVDGTAQPIVLQAIIATMATFAAALFLFRSGKVRVTPKFTQVAAHRDGRLPRLLAAQRSCCDASRRRTTTSVRCATVRGAFSRAVRRRSRGGVPDRGLRLHQAGVEPGAPRQDRVDGRVRAHRHARLAVPGVPAHLRDLSRN